MTKIIDTLALSGFWVGVKTRLNNKADASHSHVIADVASLQTLLDGKANSAHTHTIANVTGLQTALDGKSDTDHTHSLATTTTAGHMSGADKSKLDGIASGANNYSLPTASASVLGGVKVGSNLTITDGVLSATDTNTTYSAATTSTSGLMTPTDKVKLDGVAPNANNYAHPANHPPSIITQDANNMFVTDTEKSTWSGKASTAVATASADGLMAKEDKSKLDGIASGANNYTHPETHPASMITQDTSRRMVSDVQIANWDGNVDPVVLMSETAFAGITPDPSKIYIVYGE